jgi:Family of unknown function (DUF5677)
MDTLQKAISEQLTGLPRLLLADLLDQKLRGQGIKLSKRKRSELADRILTKKTNASDFNGAQKDNVKRRVTVRFTDTDSELIENKINKFMERLPTLIDDLAEKTYPALMSTLKRRWPSEARARRRDLDGFHKRLRARWGDGLEKLRMLLAIAREYGSELDGGGRKEVGGSPSKTFEILIKLHARSCQIAEEIVCLLSNGFADGAMARWRTLHEIAAVCYLIRRHGDELAERYEDHEIVEARKAAHQYRRYQERLGEEPISESDLTKIEADYALVLEKHGPEFAKPQGWAAKHLGKRNLKITEIQEAAGIDYLAPYYRMASHNVHANPKGVFFKLGLIGEDNVLLSGPSNAGLADPGHATALSLLQICSLLLHFHPTFDNIITVKVMIELKNEICSALLSAHMKLENEEKVLREPAQKT